MYAVFHLLVFKVEDSFYSQCPFRIDGQINIFVFQGFQISGLFATETDGVGKISHFLFSLEIAHVHTGISAGKSYFQIIGMSLRILKYDFHGICLTANSYGGNGCFGVDRNRHFPISGVTIGIVHLCHIGLNIYLSTCQ